MISTLVNAVHAYFPSSDTPSPKHKTENKKDRLKHLGNRKRQLRKEWRARRHEDAAETQNLRAEFHAVHKRIKRLSSFFSKVDTQAQKRKNMRAFRANPFAFGKKFFSPRNSAQPEFTLEEAHRHFSNTYADPDRTNDYNDFADAPDVMPPSVHFPKQTPSFEEF